MKKYFIHLSVILLLVLVLGCSLEIKPKELIIATPLENQQHTEPITQPETIVQEKSETSLQQPTIWIPSPSSRFQLQFTDLPMDLSIDADIYDIDLFDNDKTIVDELHAKDKKITCYINVGAWEDWREDANTFPKELIGNDYDGWEGEKWLDIRNPKLKPIMEQRFDKCQTKNFDSIEPDNINAYLQDTGFSLTYQDQLNYNIWLAEQAHKRGLSIGLKNNGEQANDLLDHFDWVLAEECLKWDECNLYQPFINAKKAVFNIEYTDDDYPKDFCGQSKQLGITTILKNRNLDSWIKVC